MASIKRSAPKQLDSAHWHITAKNNTSRVVAQYQQDEDSLYLESPERAKRTQLTMFTGNNFRDTLPLLADNLTNSSAGGIDQMPAIKEQRSVDHESTKQQTTTFEDYRLHLQTGEMEIVSESFLASQKFNSTKSKNTAIKNFNDQIRQYSTSARFVSNAQQTINSSMEPADHYKKVSLTKDNSMKMLALSLQEQDSHSQYKKRTGSKNGLPTLKRSISPGINEIQTPFAQEIIAKKLNYSSFCGYEVNKQDNATNLTLAQRLVLGSVTPQHRGSDGESSRINLLPNLNMKKQNKVKVQADLADQIINSTKRKADAPNSNRRYNNRAGGGASSLHQKYRNYEQSNVQSLLNQSNQIGRQSVQNLLQLFSPDEIQHQYTTPVDSLTPQRITIEKEPSLYLPSLRADQPTQSQYENGNGNINDYQMSVQVTSKIDQKRQYRSSRNSNIISRSLQVGGGQLNQIYRSENRPIKEILKQKTNNKTSKNNSIQVSDLTGEAPVTLSEMRLMGAFEQKSYTRAISPINIINNQETLLGYAPQTFRTKIAQGSLSPKRPVKESATKASNQSNTAMKMNLSQSKNNLNNSAILSAAKTQNNNSPSMTSLHASNSLLSQVNKNKQQQQVPQFSFQVENKKDWGPMEIASRSQVYQSKLRDETNQDIKDQVQVLKSSAAEQKQNQLVVMNGVGIIDREKMEPNYKSSQKSLQSYIKVSNQFNENKDMGTIEEIKKDQDQIEQQQKLQQQDDDPEQSENMDYHLKNGKMPITSVGQGMMATDESGLLISMSMLRPPQTANADDEVNVANQGTDTIHSQREEISVVNEEEWSQAVKDIIEKQQQHRQIQYSTLPLDDGQGLLINVESTQLIEGQKLSQQNSMIQLADYEKQMLRELDVEIKLPLSRGEKSLNSTSTMNLGLNSPIKKPIGGFNQTSNDRMKMFETNHGIKDEFSRASMGLGDNSNDDLRVVYEDKSATSTQLAKNAQGVTTTDFRVAAHSTGTAIMLNKNQFELNKSQRNITRFIDPNPKKLHGENRNLESQNIQRQGVYPPYGFTLNQRETKVLGMANQTQIDLPSASGVTSSNDQVQKVAQNIHDQKIQDFIQQQRDEKEKLAYVAVEPTIRNTNINPILLEAQKKTKQVIIREPIRQSVKNLHQIQQETKKLQQQKSKKIIVGITSSPPKKRLAVAQENNQDSPNTQTMEQGTFSMTMKSGLITRSIKLSQKEILETPMKTILTLLENENSSTSENPFKLHHGVQLHSRDSALTLESLKGQINNTEQHHQTNIIILPTPQFEADEQNNNQEYQQSQSPQQPLQKLNMSPKLQSYLSTIVQDKREQKFAIGEKKQFQRIDASKVVSNNLKQQSAPIRADDPSKCNGLPYKPFELFVGPFSPKEDKAAAAAQSLLLKNSPSNLSLRGGGSGRTSPKQQFSPRQTLSPVQKSPSPRTFGNIQNKKDQQASQKESTLFHIQQIGQSVRYQAQRSLIDTYEQQKSLMEQELLTQMALAGQVQISKATDPDESGRKKLKPVIPSLMNVSFDESVADQLRKTQFVFSSEDSQVNTQMNFREEIQNQRTPLNIIAPNRVDSEMYTQTEKSPLIDNKDSVADDNTPKFKPKDQLGMTVPKLASIYPIEHKDLNLRRSAEKFNLKYSEKIMILKPLNTSKNTSNKQQQQQQAKKSTFAPKQQKKMPQNDRIVNLVSKVEPVIPNNNQMTQANNYSKRKQQVKQFKPRLHIGDKVTRVSDDRLHENPDRGNHSKASKLSGDLQHLESYLPRYNKRINEDPLELTKSTFNNGQTLVNQTPQMTPPDPEEVPQSYVDIPQVRNLYSSLSQGQQSPEIGDCPQQTAKSSQIKMINIVQVQTSLDSDINATLDINTSHVDNVDNHDARFVPTRQNTGSEIYLENTPNGSSHAREQLVQLDSQQKSQTDPETSILQSRD